MIPRIRWRIAFSFSLFSILVVLGMSLSLFRSDCVEDRQCIAQTILISSIILISGIIVIAFFVSERTNHSIKQFTHVVQRITAGDKTARILPRTRDEVGMLIRAFNEMHDHLLNQITNLSGDYQQLATAVQHMADGVIILDNSGFVLLINPGAMRLLETTEAQALNRSFAEVVRHHQLIEVWQRCVQSGTDQIEAVEIGGDLFLQAVVTSFPQRDTRGYLVVLQDLTTIRKLQTIRQDFISNVSHELRTPLASVRAVIETLLNGALEDPQTAQRFLHRAEREIDVLTQMVEELLELSRIESGQVPIKLTPTKVSDLLLLPVERLRDQAQRKQIQLILDLPNGLPYVLADAERVQQTVSNLLHNAIKFTPEHGEITLSAQYDPDKDRDSLLISVSDTGIGIAADDLPRIFERFYKSDRARTRRHTGTGLGLAISRHIVQAHNGRLWVKSKEKKGSTFYFTLPINSIKVKQAP